MFRLFRRLTYSKPWKDAIFTLGRHAIMARRILVIPPSGNQERKTCPRQGGSTLRVRIDRHRDHDLKLNLLPGH